MASNAPATEDTGSISAATATTLADLHSLRSGISYEHAGGSSGATTADAIPASGFMPPFFRSDSRLSVTPGIEMPLSFDLTSFGLSPSETLEERKTDGAELAKIHLVDSAVGAKEGKYYRLQDDGGYRFLRRKGVSSSGPQRGWKIHVSLDYVPDNLEVAKNVLIHICATNNIPMTKIARGIGGGYQLGKGAVIYCCSARDEVVWSQFFARLTEEFQAKGVRPGGVPCHRLTIREGERSYADFTGIAEDAIPGTNGFLFITNDTCRSREEIPTKAKWIQFERDIMAGGIATPFASHAIGRGIAMDLAGDLVGDLAGQAKSPTA